MFYLYQRFLSPVLHTLLSPFTGSATACRFSPTCSEYARQAITRYGIIRGGLKALLRFLRCNPLFKGGLDPLK